VVEGLDVEGKALRGTQIWKGEVLFSFFQQRENSQFLFHKDAPYFTVPS